MKSKLLLILLVLLLGASKIDAQTEAELEKLSIFSEYVKSKNYDAAYAPWMELRTTTPKLNKAIYIFGERILKDKISNSEGDQKTAYILDLLKLWEERSVNFSKITPKGAYLAKASQLKYDNRNLLGESNEILYANFDSAYNSDVKTFTNPKSLYTYFSLMVGLK